MAYQWDFSPVLANAPLLAQGLANTLKITGTALVSGVVLGLALALLRLSPRRFLSAPATNGVISMPTRIGRAKKNQKSWTSGGVVRNTSMTKPAGHDRNRRGDRRSSASARPSTRPQTSAVPVI